MHEDLEISRQAVSSDLGLAALRAESGTRTDGGIAVFARANPGPGGDDFSSHCSLDCGCPPLSVAYLKNWILNPPIRIERDNERAPILLAESPSLPNPNLCVGAKDFVTRQVNSDAHRLQLRAFPDTSHLDYSLFNELEPFVCQKELSPHRIAVPTVTALIPDRLLFS